MKSKNMKAIRTIVELKPGNEQYLEELISLYKRAFDEEVENLENKAEPEQSSESEFIIGQAKSRARYQLQNVLINPQTHCFVVLETSQNQTKVIAGATCFELDMLTKPVRELYLYDIAVDEGCRRQGVATNLIHQIVEFARQEKITTIFVQASESDVEAVKFYQSLGSNLVVETEKVDLFVIKV